MRASAWPEPVPRHIEPFAREEEPTAIATPRGAILVPPPPPPKSDADIFEPTAVDEEGGVLSRASLFGFTLRRKPSPVRDAAGKSIQMPALGPSHVRTLPLHTDSTFSGDGVDGAASSRSAFASARSCYEDLTPRSGARAAQREYLARMEAELGEGGVHHRRSQARPPNAASPSQPPALEAAAVAATYRAALRPASARVSHCEGKALIAVGGAAKDSTRSTAHSVTNPPASANPPSACAPSAVGPARSTQLSLWELCESDDHLAELKTRLARASLRQNGKAPSAGGAGRSHQPLSNVNVRSHHPKTLRTPLHVAAANGARNAVVALLQAGSEPAAICALGRTPLDEALDHEHWAVVKLLLWMYADSFAPLCAPGDDLLQPADDRPLGVTLPACGTGGWSWLAPNGQAEGWLPVHCLVVHVPRQPCDATTPPHASRRTLVKRKAEDSPRRNLFS